MPEDVYGPSDDDHLDAFDDSMEFDDNSTGAKPVRAPDAIPDWVARESAGAGSSKDVYDIQDIFPLPPAVIAELEADMQKSHAWIHGFMKKQVGNRERLTPEARFAVTYRAQLEVLTDPNFEKSIIYRSLIAKRVTSLIEQLATYMANDPDAFADGRGDDWDPKEH